MAALELVREGATAVLTMNRPAQLNAMNLDMRAEFAEAIAQVRDDHDVRAVVITGAGGNFCSGADVGLMAGSSSAKENIFDKRERPRRIHRWFDHLTDLEKPVIAAVNGIAYGAGLSVALAADFILASPLARFCSLFARVGYVPYMGAMYLLPRAVGLAQAKDIVFTGRVIGAAEAREMGLVHRVEDNVLASAMKFAAGFHQAPTGATGLAKSIMNRAFERIVPRSIPRNPWPRQSAWKANSTRRPCVGLRARSRRFTNGPKGRHDLFRRR